MLYYAICLLIHCAISVIMTCWALYCIILTISYILSCNHTSVRYIAVGRCISYYMPCTYDIHYPICSANNNMLEVKRTRTKAGDCSFAVAAASLWNNLPTVIKTCDNLTSFKRLLKTHFCRIAY